MAFGSQEGGKVDEGNVCCVEGMWWEFVSSVA